MYKKNLFKLSSKSLFRDFCIVAGCIGYMEGGEYLVNEFMWSNVKDIVKEYGLKKRLESSQRMKVLSSSRYDMQETEDSLDDSMIEEGEGKDQKQKAGE